MTLEEFHNIKQLIQYDFLQDGHFTELKEAELMENKLQTLGTIESYIGTFFSKKWVQQNVLRLTDLEIEEMQKQINKDFLDRYQMMVVLMFHTDTDGITRYPSVDGAPIPADDVAKYKR